MLSPSSSSSKRTGRASSTWSIDSGYGSGLYEDTKIGLNLSSRDLPTSSVPRQQSIGLGIDCLSAFQAEANISIKKEYNDFEPSTPQLRVCTAFSNPSSPDPVSPASPSEVRRSHARRATSKLPAHAVAQLNEWLDANRLHPYPTAEAKQALAQACRITVKQVTTWFTNSRQRQLKSQDGGSSRVADESNHMSTQASRKGKKKDYGRTNGASPIEGFLSPPRLSPCASVSEHSSGEGDIWQCTFCRVPLTAKSWRRHEETQHHPKFQWTCLALGPRVQLPSYTSTICPFCELQDPDDSHFLHYHRVRDCLCKDAKERTFGRPDHLQQHARNFHKCQRPLNDLVRDAWRSDGPGMIDNKTWTCGFCQEVLHTWDTRATHIAGHFKAGRTMAQWRDSLDPQSTISRERTLSRRNSMSDDTVLDILASMGTTFAGPSNHGSHSAHHARIDSAQFLQPQSRSMTTLVPPTSIPDLEFDPFCMWGNPVDTFDPSLSAPTTYYPAVNSMPAPTQNAGVSSMEFGIIGFDQAGNPIYDPSLMHSW